MTPEVLNRVDAFAIGANVSIALVLVHTLNVEPLMFQLGLAQEPVCVYFGALLYVGGNLTL